MVNNSQRSHFIASNVGVRQGDAISPFHFKLYVSDFQSYIGIGSNAPLLNTPIVNCLIHVCWWP